MRTISSFTVDVGISTVVCAARMPLRTRVRRSAMGSEKALKGLPGRLGHAGNHAAVSELTQADPADAELAVDSARAATLAASRVSTGLVLRRPSLADALRSLSHASCSPS